MYPVADYFETGSIPEALNLLSDSAERQVIAGGTDLLIKMRDGDLEKVNLVSIRRIKELGGIKMGDDQSITIGPLTTFTELAEHEVIKNNVPILAEAAMTVGGPQIRNMATIGGNVCNGVPSADSAPPLFALNALLKLQAKESERLVPVQEFYLGPGRVDLRPGELLTEIRITRDNYLNYGGCYIKFAPRKAMDLAIVGVAVLCRLEGKEVIDQLRISLGVAGPIPLRCAPAEAYGLGKEASETTADQIGKLAVESSKARDSYRASREYREHLIGELTRRAFAAAVARAGGA